MRIFAVDENNDLYLGASGQLVMKTDLEALMQACEHAMQSLYGEMAFCAARGLPYEETVWSGTPNLRAFEDRARGTLQAMEGVTGVDSFECAVNGDVLAYEAVIRSVYGVFTISTTGNGNG